MYWIDYAFEVDTDFL